jgi:membrane protein YdbS with pleckstrin-like domain
MPATNISLPPKYPAMGNSLTWILKERWFWMLAVGLMAAIILPLLIAWFVVSLRPELMVVALVAILVVWLIFRSYRNWSANADEKEAGISEPACTFEFTGARGTRFLRQ